VSDLAITSRGSLADGRFNQKQTHRHSVIRGLQRGAKGGGFDRGREGKHRGINIHSSFVVVVCCLDFDKKRFKTGWMTDRFSRNSTQTTLETRITTHAAPMLVVAMTTQSVGFEA